MRIHSQAGSRLVSKIGVVVGDEISVTAGGVLGASVASIASTFVTIAGTATTLSVAVAKDARVMFTSDGVVSLASTISNAISSDDCKIIIDDINSSNLKQGTVSGVLNTEMKDLLVSPRNFTDQKPASMIIGNALYSYKEDYIKEHPQLNKIHKWDVDSLYNLQKYNPGQGYHISHCENMGGRSLVRVLAWMIYLNDLDNGGTYFDNYELTVNAVRGRLVIWPSYWTHFHRGVISTTQTKYIATGWLRFVKDNSSSPLDWILGNN